MVLIMLFLAAGLAFVLDQTSKKLALTRFEGEACAPGWSGPRIRVVRNTRIGLGLVRNPKDAYFALGRRRHRNDSFGPARTIL